MQHAVYIFKGFRKPFICCECALSCEDLGVGISRSRKDNEEWAWRMSRVFPRCLSTFLLRDDAVCALEKAHLFSASWCVGVALSK